MEIDIRKANLPADAVQLREIDLQIFGEADAFEGSYWLALETYWVVVDGTVAGCTGFSHNVNFQEDVREDEENVPQDGTLYIETTGILAGYRGRGVGSHVKEWQIDYAKRNGFKRIVTNCRESNLKMISLNTKYGFRVTRITPGYYADPIESTVVMERSLQDVQSSS
jgi:ribosomal protein S18 acetylase RimI-like enzyme